MKKIIYLHGLGPSGEDKTAVFLRMKLRHSVAVSPDIPLEPMAALQYLKDLCVDIAPDLVIGTAMGAMYAQQLKGYKKILVNPVFHPSEVMRQNLGINKNLNSQQGGGKDFEITPLLIEKYEEMESRQFEGVTDEDRQQTYAFFGTEDNHVNNQEEYAQYYHHSILYPGSHRLQYKLVKELVLSKVIEVLGSSNRIESFFDTCADEGRCLNPTTALRCLFDYYSNFNRYHQGNDSFMKVLATIHTAIESWLLFIKKNCPETYEECCTSYRRTIGTQKHIKMSQNELLTNSYDWLELQNTSKETTYALCWGIKRSFYYKFSKAKPATFASTNNNSKWNVEQLNRMGMSI